MKTAGISCFVSYSWEGEKHRDWVRALASKLMENGVDTRLDQWDTRLGMDLAEYMERSVRESDYVLLVCTPRFAERADAGLGGVGYEKTVVTGEILTGAGSENKFIPLLRTGSPGEALPSYLRSRLFIDFRDDARFDEVFQLLLRDLFVAPEFEKPAVGSPPDLRPLPKITPQNTTPRPPSSPSKPGRRTTGRPNMEQAEGMPQSQFRKRRTDFYHDSDLLDVDQRQVLKLASRILGSYTFAEFQQELAFPQDELEAALRVLEFKSLIRRTKKGGEISWRLSRAGRRFLKRHPLNLYL